MFSLWKVTTEISRSDCDTVDRECFVLKIFSLWKFVALTIIDQVAIAVFSLWKVTTEISRSDCDTVDRECFVLKIFSLWKFVALTIIDQVATAVFSLKITTKISRSDCNAVDRECFVLIFVVKIRRASNNWSGCDRRIFVVESHNGNFPIRSWHSRLRMLRVKNIPLWKIRRANNYFIIDQVVIANTVIRDSLVVKKILSRTKWQKFLRETFFFY